MNCNLNARDDKNAELFENIIFFERFIANVLFYIYLVLNVCLVFVAACKRDFWTCQRRIFRISILSTCVRDLCSLTCFSYFFAISILTATMFVIYTHRLLTSYRRWSSGVMYWSPAHSQHVVFFQCETGFKPITHLFMFKIVRKWCWWCKMMSRVMLIY